jgi:hypothetical protein
MESRHAHSKSESDIQVPKTLLALFDRDEDVDEELLVLPPPALTPRSPSSRSPSSRIPSSPTLASISESILQPSSPPAQPASPHLPVPPASAVEFIDTAPLSLQSTTSPTLSSARPFKPSPPPPSFATEVKFIERSAVHPTSGQNGKKMARFNEESQFIPTNPNSPTTPGRRESANHTLKEPPVSPTVEIVKQSEPKKQRFPEIPFNVPRSPKDFLRLFFKFCPTPKDVLAAMLAYGLGIAVFIILSMTLFSSPRLKPRLGSLLAMQTLGGRKSIISIFFLVFFSFFFFLLLFFVVVFFKLKRFIVFFFVNLTHQPTTQAKWCVDWRTCFGVFHTLARLLIHSPLRFTCPSSRTWWPQFRMMRSCITPFWLCLCLAIWPWAAL